MAKFEPQIVTTDSLLKPELIFFGSGYVSRRSLEAVADSFSTEAVISKSGGGAHDSQKITATQKYADEHGIDCFTADTKDELVELFSRHHFRSQLGLVVDYGVIIPEDVINFFPLGIINSHFSLLPKYRGADPIRAAIINRDDTTGITAMKITPRLDDGPILDQVSLELDKTETARDLTGSLLNLQDDWLPQTLLKYQRGDIEPTAQDESQATHTSKLAKADGKIDWSEPAATIEAKIRAYQPWPGAFTTLSGKQLTILAAQALDEQPSSNQKLGQAYVNNKDLIVNCGDSTALSIQKLKIHGRSEISAVDFMNGYYLEPR